LIDISFLLILQPTIFNGAIPLPLYKIQIIGIKSIPRDIVFGKGNLKFLTLKGIEDIPQISVFLQALNISPDNSVILFIDMSIENRDLRLSNILSSLDNDVLCKSNLRRLLGFVQTSPNANFFKLCGKFYYWPSEECICYSLVTKCD
jgi:hypothetical protein